MVVYMGLPLRITSITEKTILNIKYSKTDGRMTGVKDHVNQRHPNITVFRGKHCDPKFGFFIWYLGNHKSPNSILLFHFTFPRALCTEGLSLCIVFTDHGT